MSDEKTIVPFDITLRADLDEDVLKVAHFIGSNIPPERAIKVAQWMAQFAPPLWEKPDGSKHNHDRLRPLKVWEVQASATQHHEYDEPAQ